jgi:hypothetical protein
MIGLLNGHVNLYLSIEGVKVDRTRGDDRSNYG